MSPVSIHAAPLGAAKYTRYNVMSAGGKKALASYAKGVEAMLKLPPDHPAELVPQCLRPFDGLSARELVVLTFGIAGIWVISSKTIRKLKRRSGFAMPYWDWTTLPRFPMAVRRCPDSADHAFDPYTANLAVFTSFIQPGVDVRMDKLSPHNMPSCEPRLQGVLNMWVRRHRRHALGSRVLPATFALLPRLAGPANLTRENPKLDKNTPSTYRRSSLYPACCRPIILQHRATLTLQQFEKLPRQHAARRDHGIFHAGRFSATASTSACGPLAIPVPTAT